MDRSKVALLDTWDLTRLYQDDAKYEEDYQAVEADTALIEAMKGHLLENEKTLLAYLKANDSLYLKLNRLYVYSYLYYYQDTTNGKGKSLKEKVEFLCQNVNERLDFVKTELLSKDFLDVKKLIKKDKALEEYAFSLESMYRYKMCTLSDEEERIITLAGNAFGTGDEAFEALDNADAAFESIVKDGKELPLNHSTYSNFLIDENRSIRMEAFKKYYAFYEHHQNTLTSLYKGQVREDNFITKVRGFNSFMEYCLYEDNISKDVYLNLIATVHKNLDSLYDYLNFRKEFLGLDELHMYDLHIELCKPSDKKYSFKEAENLIMEALKPLGASYVKDLSQAFKNRWIDRYNNTGKRSGAYEWGTYGVEPYVSVNFEGDYSSVSTIIHELGHAMHSYYSNKKQTFVNSSYPIFLAEIASTVNEVLLNEYMLKNAKSNEEKMFYLTKFLDEFRTTVYRQTEFAEFEYLVHNMDKEGIPLTSESLYKTYYDLNKLYYGEETVSDKEIGYEWSRIPHFYTPFYVYKYATGFSCAIKIANDILNHKENALKNYLEFLSSGGSDYPLNILKKCGIDLTDGSVTNDAIKMFQDRLQMAKNLRKEMINNGCK